MNLLSIEDFGKECGLGYEAIRVQIDKTLIPTTRDPIMIDIDKYDFFIKYHKNRVDAK